MSKPMVLSRGMRISLVIAWIIASIFIFFSWISLIFGFEGKWSFMGKGIEPLPITKILFFGIITIVAILVWIYFIRRWQEIFRKDLNR